MLNAGGMVSEQSMWEIEELMEGGTSWKARGKTLDVRGWS